MKIIVALALYIMVATVAAQLYDKGIEGIGGIGGLRGIGGLDGFGGIEGIGGNGGRWGVIGGIGIGSTYCSSSYCFNGQCSGLDRYAYYLGRLCYCSCGSY